MKKYRVTWVEEPVQVWYVDIEANSKEEAIEKAENGAYQDYEDILREKSTGRYDFEAEEINE